METDPFQPQVEVEKPSRAEAAPRERESLHRAAERIAKVGGWRVDLETHEVHWTEQTRRLHEVPDDYQPSLAEAIGFFHPEERQKLGAALQRAIDGGEGYDMELRFITAKGAERWVRTVCQPRVVNGRVVELVGAIQDISEHKQVVEQLQRRDGLAALGQMAAGIAHEFLNRVNVILLFAQMGLRDPGLTPGLEQRLNAIVAESHGIADLVHRIVDFSGRAMVDPQPTDLALLAANTVDALRPQLPAGVRLILEMEPDEYVVKADAARIRQVLTNLVLNACDAMPGGGDLRVVLSHLELETSDLPRFGQFCRPVGDLLDCDWICLAVVDSGMGMTEDVQKYLFQPFFTTREVGKGTGLGLAQVYGIVRQHQGAIDVETRSGEGTTIRICLPAHGRMEADVDAAPAEAADRHPSTLLVVEKDDSLRAQVSGLFESLGYRVVTARDGPQALAVCRSPRWSRHPAQRIDLLIASLSAADMNGLNLVRELRRMHPMMDALLIAEQMPHGHSPETLEAAGIKHVVERPLEVKALAGIVQSILGA